MNAWQIAGTIISVIGTILMAYGAHVQSQSDGAFQTKVGDYVANQQAEEVPEVVALSIKGQANDYLLEVQNIGRRSATKVKLIFSEKSTPNIFAGNLISGANEIPQSTKYTLPLNLFSGVNLLSRVPNSDPEFKAQMTATLKKFKDGEMALIPRFYIEYYHGEKRLESPTYFMVLDAQGGKPGFGKVDSN